MKLFLGVFSIELGIESKKETTVLYYNVIFINRYRIMIFISRIHNKIRLLFLIIYYLRGSVLIISTLTNICRCIANNVSIKCCTTICNSYKLDWFTLINILNRNCFTNQTCISPNCTHSAPPWNLQNNATRKVTNIY